MHNRIRALREALHLSQREFGEKLGVSRDVIGNLEYGRVDPKPLFLQHLCQLYQVNPHWLEAGEGEMFDSAPEDGKWLKALAIFKALRPEFQDYALEQIWQLAQLQEKIQP